MALATVAAGTVSTSKEPSAWPMTIRADSPAEAGEVTERRAAMVAMTATRTRRTKDASARLSESWSCSRSYARQVLGDTEQARIALTVACRDSDAIPKVADAGAVRDGVQLMRNGVRVVEGGYYGEWMTEVIRRLRGHHEPQEEVAFHAVLERLATTAGPSPAILELGAFWAYYSLWFLHRIPGGRAFLVEPDPAYLEIGRRNIELNDFEATFHQAAVGH